MRKGSAAMEGFLRKGSMLAQRYILQRKAGDGGSAEVWEALDLERPQVTVIVKAVQDREQGIREREIHARLRHRGIPALEDSFMTEGRAAPEGCFCLVMEHIEGETLESIVRRKGPLPLGEAVDTGRQLCEILGWLHGLDPPVFHCDVKPANVLLAEDGSVTLLDFGSAFVPEGVRDPQAEYAPEAGFDPQEGFDPEAGDASEPGYTSEAEYAPGAERRAGRRPEMRQGTPGYAAPELFGGGQEPDARTDVYGICAVLHFALTGESPLQTGFKSVGDFVPELRSTPLEKLLNRCLSVRPSLRCESTQELNHRLDRITRSRNKGAGAKLWEAVRRVLSLAAVFAGISALLPLGENIARARGYGRLLVYSQKASAAEDRLSFLEEAIREEPGRSEAYRHLLDAVAEDGIIDDGERIRLGDCLYAAAGEDRGTLTCLEFFRRTDPEACGRFILRMGAEYYAGCEAGISEAARFLEEAAQDQALSMQERRFAADMGILAGAGAPPDSELDSELDALERLAEDAPGFLTGKNIFRERKTYLALALLRGISVRILYERETGMLTGKENGHRAQEVIRKAENCLIQAETMRDQIPEDLLLQARTAAREARNALSGEAYWR